MPGFRDLTGQRFHKLIALQTDGKNCRGQFRWRCKCDCGSIVTVQSGNLTSGNTTSCGCVQAQNRSLSTRTHGLSRDPIVRSHYYHMMYRCYSSSDENHVRNYQSRGIAVCDDWRGHPDAFLAYVTNILGPRPGPAFTIDRIDNDRGYEPGNLRWATPLQQARNTRLVSPSKRRQGETE